MPLLFVLGLLIGSFLNVLIYRMPRGENFVSGRSHCVHCGKVLAWYDLVPLLSFLVLRGRCRYCHIAVSLQYPLIELISGVLFVFLWSQPFLLISLELLLVVAVIDLQHFVILDSLLIILVCVALIHERSWANVITSLVAAAAFFSLWFLSKGKWIGFGDVKLVGVLGLLFGFPATLAIIYCAVILGGFLGIILILLRKATMKTALPFGTLLVTGTIVFVVFRTPLYEIFSRF